jgi:hypothetical protein
VASQIAETSAREIAFDRLPGGRRLAGGSAPRQRHLSRGRQCGPFRPHRHDYHELIWTREGAAEHLIDGEVDAARCCPRLSSRLRRAPSWRGSRAHLGRPGRADDPRRTCPRAWRGQGDEDAGRSDGSTRRSAQGRPESAPLAGRCSEHQRADRARPPRWLLAEHDWCNWRRRVFQPAAEAVGLGTIRPYDLRHSFVSLLTAEGRNIVEVARQAGHSPSMALDTYGHVFDALDGDKRRPAEKVIRKARAKVIRKSRCTLGAPLRGRCCLRRERNSAICGAFQEPSDGLEPSTPPYHGTSPASGRNAWQRISLVSTVSGTIAFATGCHRLQPRGSIKAPSAFCRMSRRLSSTNSARDVRRTDHPMNTRVRCSTRTIFAYFPS